MVIVAGLLFWRIRGETILPESESIGSDRSACRGTRSPIVQGCVLGTRVSDLGWAAALTHPPVRFRPGGQCRIRLCPMRYRGLITPVQEMGHNPLVRAAGHEGAHTLLRIPCCHRPKSPVAIRQQSASHKSGGFLHLLPRAKHIEEKRRKKTYRPHPESREADKYHRQISHKRLRSINERRPRFAFAHDPTGSLRAQYTIIGNRAPEA